MFLLLLLLCLPGVAQGAMVASPLVRTGFRQFSQRATRLQFLQRTLKGRGSILGDVFTNKQSSDGSKMKHRGWVDAVSEDNEEEESGRAGGDGTIHYGAIGGGARRYLPERLQDTATTRMATLRRQTQEHPRSISLLKNGLGVVEEALGGFVAGYIVAGVTDLSRMTYRGLREIVTSLTKTPDLSTTVTPRAVTSVNELLPYPELTQCTQQALRSHARCVQWATEWGKISAVFGACRFLCQTLREHPPSSWTRLPLSLSASMSQAHRKDTYRDADAWDSVSGSALAGAILAAVSTLKARTEPSLYDRLTWVPGPTVRSALLYGGVMLLLHPQLWRQCAEALQLAPPYYSSTTISGTSRGMLKEIAAATIQENNEFLVMRELSAREHRYLQAKPWYDHIGLLE